MIISRTPYRISFFGGGTDYPGWYLKHGGSVLATTINKFCYISCRYLPPFFEHRIRVVYSNIESCKSVDEIVHPSIRECLKFLNFDRGLEIHHDGDLPARSGMGSSSAFTVGFLHALYALKGCMPSKQQLAEESIHIEQDLIKETVGSQDQVSAAFGGLNHITFGSNGSIHVRPMTLLPERISDLDNSLMLFYTGIVRTASDVAKSYVDDIDCKKRQLRIMKDLLEEGISLLVSNRDINEFGELLDEAWQAKRSLSCSVSNPQVDELYNRAMSSGAIGGKLTGAGGGGFLLLFVEPHKQRAVIENLNHLIQVPFRFDFSGSQIIFCDRGEDYSALDDRRNKQIHPFQELEKNSRTEDYD